MLSSIALLAIARDNLTPPFVGSLLSLVERTFPGRRIKEPLRTDLCSRLVFTASSGASKTEVLELALSAWHYQITFRGDEFLVQRDAKRADERVRAEYTQLSEALSGEIKKRLDNHPHSAALYEKEMRQFQSLGALSLAQTPLSALHLELLKGIGPQSLVRAPIFKATVWSDSPTPAERPLQFSSSLAIDRFHRLRKELSFQLRTNSAESWNLASSKDIFPVFFYEGEFRKVHLFFIPMGQRAFSGLHLYAQDGKSLGSSYQEFNLVSEAQESLSLNDAVLIQPNSDALDDVLRAPMRASRANLDHLLSLVKEEPHKILSIHLLQQLHSKDLKCVAIPLTDSVFLSLVAARPKTRRSLIKAIASAGVDLREENHCLIGNVTDEANSDQLSIPRVALNYWLQNPKAASLEWLKAEGELAFKYPLSVRLSKLDEWIKTYILYPLREEVLVSPLVNFEFLQAIGSLNPSEWQAISSGSPVPLSHNVLGSKALVELANRIHALQPQGDGALPDLFRTGTVALPFGMPSGSSLLLTMTRDAAVMPEGVGKKPRLLSQMAYSLGNSLQAWSEFESVARQTFSGQLGELSRPKIDVFYGREYKFGEVIHLDKFVSKSPGLSFDDWPQRTKDEIRAIAKRAFDSKGDVANNRPPP